MSQSASEYSIELCEDFGLCTRGARLRRRLIGPFLLFRADQSERWMIGHDGEPTIARARSRVFSVTETVLVASACTERLVSLVASGIDWEKIAASARHCRRSR